MALKSHQLRINHLKNTQAGTQKAAMMRLWAFLKLSERGT